MNLDPIDPATAVDLYLDDRETEVTEATLTSHRSRLGQFVEWCGQQGLENLNDLTGRRLHQYRVWRRNDGDLAPASEKTQMDTLRVFVRWLESIDAVVPDLHTKVLSPSLAPGENVRTASLDGHDARKVLAYLSTYHYATAEHVTLTLLWHMSMRTGGVRAIDVDDYHPRDQYVEVRHRPETGSPIKNKFRGERLVALSADTCELIDDYLASLLAAAALAGFELVEETVERGLGVGDHRVIPTSNSRELNLGLVSCLGRLNFCLADYRR
jgi:site-specific recombinase XerD